MFVGDLQVVVETSTETGDRMARRSRAPHIQSKRAKGGKDTTELSFRWRGYRDPVVLSDANVQTNTRAEQSVDRKHGKYKTRQLYFVLNKKKIGIAEKVISELI